MNQRIKFRSEFQQELKHYLKVSRECLSFSREIWRLLHVISKKSKIAATQRDLIRISVECLQSTLLLAKAGFLSEALLLNRWQLEISHLNLYLARNPSDFYKWSMKGRKIHLTRDIGGYLKSIGYNSSKTTYDGLCNVTHLNAGFVCNFNLFASDKNKTRGQQIILGRVIINAVWFGTKAVFGCKDILKSEMGSDYEAIVTKYNRLEKTVRKINKEQSEIESRFIAE